MTLLCLASEKGHFEVVKLLLMYGNENSIVSDDRKTAAAMAKSKEIANLIVHFADSQRNMHGQCTQLVQTNCLIQFRVWLQNQLAVQIMMRMKNKYT